MEKFQIFRTLRSEGKLHGPLILRIEILLGISAVLLGIVVYENIVGNLNIFISIAVGVISFLLGLFIFSKMNKVEWNEEKEVIGASRMDLAGFTVLLLYIAFEFSFRHFLKSEYAGTYAATGYLFAGIGASLLGRSVGTLLIIQRFAKDEKI